MMVAGEASADVYGARILEQLRALDPGTQAFGIGGEQLRRAGLRLHGEAHQLAIVGFTAVLGRLLPVIRLYRRLLRLLRDEPPDVLVCIDLPDFNLMLASQARARGIPVLFDISPQFWAWRPGRIEKIAGRISKMIVAFPFEVPFYQRAGVPVAFHGHPLLEGLARRFPSRDAALRHFGLDPARRTLVLAPGSRRERDRASGARALRRRGAARARASRLAARGAARAAGRRGADPDAPRAAPASRSSAPAATSSTCCAAADFGILCSGTVTLEAALAGLPMVIVYRGNWLNVFLARRLIRIDRIGLPNIVLGGERCVFPELIQEDAAPEPLAARVDALLRQRSGARGAARRLRAGRRPAGGRPHQPRHRGGSARARGRRAARESRAALP